MVNQKGQGMNNDQRKETPRLGIASDGREQHWLECLSQLAAVTSEQEDLIEVARQTYSALEPLLTPDAFMMSLYYREDDESEYIYAVVDGKEVSQQRYQQRIKLVGSRIEPMIRSRKPLLVDNWRLEEHGYEVITLSPNLPRVHTLLDVPFVASDEVLGTLHLQSYNYKAWGEEEVEFVQMVAALLLGAVLHQRIVMCRNSKGSYASCLHSISRECISDAPIEQITARLAEIVARFIDAVCVVLRKEGETVRLATVFHSDPVVSAIQTDFIEHNLDRILNSDWASPLRTGEPMLLVAVDEVNSASEEWIAQVGAGTVAIAPIILRGQVIGQISVASFAPAHSLLDYDVRLLECAAAYLALAMANSELLPGI
jgi:GAF domain-containing protein